MEGIIGGVVVTSCIFGGLGLLAYLKCPMCQSEDWEAIDEGSWD